MVRPEIVMKGWVLDYLASKCTEGARAKMAEVRAALDPKSRRGSRKLREAVAVLFPKKEVYR